MSTEFFNDQWRIPSNENQNKVSNYSMKFDGATSEYVQIGPPPSNAFLQPSEAELNANGYSVSAWIKIDSGFASTGGIFANDGIPQTGRAYGLEFYIGSSRKLAIRKGDGTGRFSADVRVAVSVETVPLNAWTHVVFVLPSATNTTWQIYINGVASTMTTTGSGGAVGYSSVYSGGIGRYRFEYFVGQIDQVTIFDYALSPIQVASLGLDGYAFNFIPNDYINAGTGLGNSLGTYTGDASISLWFKADTTTSNDGLFSMTPFDDVVFGNLRININNNVLNFVSSALVGYKYISFTDTTSWHHLVCIFKSGDITNSKIYLDGVDQVTTDFGTFPSSLSMTGLKTIIGAYHAPANTFDGKMSNVSFFNTGLSQSQVTTLYNNGKPLTDMSSFTSLQGWWKLDDTATFNSSTSVWTIPDASTNSNDGLSVDMTSSSLVASDINGELIANPMITSPKPIAYYQLGDQSAYNGASYLVPNNSLDGYVFKFVNPNDGINVPASTDFNFGTGDFTISMWFKINSFPSFPYLFDFRPTSAPTTDAPGAYISTTTNRVNIFGGGTIISGSAGKILATGIWYNFVVKRTGNTFTTHYDGGSADQTGTNTVDFNTDLELHIGSRYDNTNGFDGEISNFQIFNTALPQTGSNSIETIYNNGSPLTSMSGFTSLQAWYKLNASEVFNSTSTEWSVDNNAHPSVYKSSLDFDGSTQAIDCGSGSKFDIDQITISSWVKLSDNLTNINVIGGIRNTNNGIITYMINHHNNGKFRFVINQSSDSTYKLVYANDDTVLNTWYHVVGVADGSNVKLYINGILQTDQTTYDGTITSPTQNFNIGRQPSAAAYYFDGQISNVAVFNTGLSQSQVQTIYNNGTPEVSISHSPVSWWKLDNTTTGLIDNGSSSNNGTNIGTTKYDGFVNALAGESVSMDSSNLVVSDLQQTSGYSPYALDFDGTNDYLNTGNHSIFQITGAMTVSYWFNGQGGSGTVGGFGKLGGSNNRGFCLGLNNNNNITFYIAPTINSLVAATYSHTADNNWHHLLGVFTPSTSLELYFDGVLVATTSTSVSSQYNGSNNLQIGARGDGAGPFNGKMSNAAIWNTSLTSTEVTEIYNQGVPSNLNTFSGTAPIGWWQIGSNSSYNSNAWTCLDEIGDSNFQSTGGMTNSDIVDGPGYSASGLGSSSIDIKGDAPYSTANGLSENMDVLDRTLDTPIKNTHSVELDGVDDCVSFSQTFFASNYEVSYSFWVKPDTYVDTIGYLIGGTSILAGGIGYSQGRSTGSYSPGRVLYYTGQGVTYTNAYLTENVWNHLVVTFGNPSTPSNRVMKVYKNGVLQSTHTGGFFGTYSQIFNLIGKAWSNPVNGKMDEVAIFSSELSAPQVASIWNNGTPGNILPLNPALWYRFESTTDNNGLIEVSDDSGNGKTGQLRNGASLSTVVP